MLLSLRHDPIRGHRSIWVIKALLPSTPCRYFHYITLSRSLSWTAIHFFLSYYTSFWVLQNTAEDEGVLMKIFYPFKNCSTLFCFEQSCSRKIFEFSTYKWHKFYILNFDFRRQICPNRSRKESIALANCLALSHLKTALRDTASSKRLEHFLIR